MRIIIAATCAALCLLAARSASAACTFQVLPMPVTFVGTRPVVTAKIDGQEAHFLIDSGSVDNIASYRLLAAHHLLKPDGSFKILGYRRLVGANGKEFSAPETVIPSIEFLGTTFHNVEFDASDRLTNVDGLIGQPMLRKMDVEFDLKDHVIRMVQTQDCKDTDMVYWARDGQAYSKMPMAWADRDDPGIFGDIFINGKKMRAKFDTGASTSFITQSAASKAGVQITDAGVNALGKAAGLDTDFDSWLGIFTDVKIGDEEISNAPFLIGQSTAREFDVLLGADFFRSHHVYVSHIQDKIYFAYEGGPPFLASVLAAARAQSKPAAPPPSKLSASPASPPAP